MLYTIFSLYYKPLYCFVLSARNKVLLLFILRINSLCVFEYFKLSVLFLNFLKSTAWFALVGNTVCFAANSALCANRGSFATILHNVQTQAVLLLIRQNVQIEAVLQLFQHCVQIESVLKLIVHYVQIVVVLQQFCTMCKRRFFAAY